MQPSGQPVEIDPVVRVRHRVEPDIELGADYAQMVQNRQVSIGDELFELIAQNSGPGQIGNALILGDVPEPMPAQRMIGDFELLRRGPQTGPSRQRALDPGPLTMRATLAFTRSNALTARHASRLKKRERRRDVHFHGAPYIRANAPPAKQQRRKSIADRNLCLAVELGKPTIDEPAALPDRAPPLRP